MKNYSESMLESMSNGVITLNEDERIVTCNAASLRIREVDRVQVKGRTQSVEVYEVLDYYTEETYPNLMEVVNHFRDGLALYRRRGVGPGGCGVQGGPSRESGREVLPDVHRALRLLPGGASRRRLGRRLDHENEVIRK